MKGRSEEEFQFFLTCTSTTSTPLLFFPLTGSSHMLRHALTSGEAQRVESQHQQSARSAVHTTLSGTLYPADEHDNMSDALAQS